MVVKTDEFGKLAMANIPECGMLYIKHLRPEVIVPYELTLPSLDRTPIISYSPTEINIREKVKFTYSTLVLVFEDHVRICRPNVFKSGIINGYGETPFEIIMQDGAYKDKDTLYALLAVKKSTYIDYTKMSTNPGLFMKCWEFPRVGRKCTVDIHICMETIGELRKKLTKGVTA